MVQLATSAIEIDEDDVNVLEETLSKVSSLTDQITASLNKLALSASVAERAIQPIAGKAQMLAIYERNINASLQVVDGIRDYAKMTEKCGEVIEAGPRNVGVPKYCSTIQQLDTSLQELNSSQLRSFHKVIDKASKLKRQGISAMKDYFRSVLADSFEYIDASDYVTKEASFPIFAPDKVATLQQLYQFFESGELNDGGPGSIHDIYFEIAARYMQASLAPLQSRCQTFTSSGPTALGGLNPSGSSVSLVSGGQAQYEKGSNAIVLYSEALCKLLGAEVTNAQQLFNGDETKTKKYFDGISDLTVPEFISISKKINDHVSKNIQTDYLLAFELLDAVSQVSTMFQRFSYRQSTNAGVGAHVNQLLQRCQKTAQAVFSTFIKYIETRVESAQPVNFTENGVSDATVEVMTRMKRLSQYKQSQLSAIATLAPGSWLIQQNSATPMMAQQNTGGAGGSGSGAQLSGSGTPGGQGSGGPGGGVGGGPLPPGSGAGGPSKPRWAQVYSTSGFVQESAAGNPVELLSSFYSDCIDALFVCLELKAKSLQKKNTQVGFFLLTNLTVIEHYVTVSSDMYKILGNSGADRLEKLKNRGLNLFLEGWKSAAALLMDVTVVKGAGSSNAVLGGKSGLSSKDREAIKEKFRTFNAEFENLIKTHKGYNITNQALRQTLAKEVKFISPMYHRFYDRHSGGDFSKHVEKYIKYTKQDFDKILESLE